ncbi:hypothetical protein [Paenibacillus crassostreae]|uniref:hypothetical protein n=1 Tax=Paenibacillus crassostreae TaxID=1763538 RepID=UPI0012FD15FB|nr:hypothetical protein [Paenibacillus crassostreae]
MAQVNSKKCQPAKWQRHPVKIERFASSFRQLKPVGRQKYETLGEIPAKLK